MCSFKVQWKQKDRYYYKLTNSLTQKILFIGNDQITDKNQSE